MTTTTFPTVSQLVHKFLCERRYPVTLIEPRVSLGTFTFVPFGWVGFYPSFDGKGRASHGTFAIDLAETNLDFSFKTNCANVNLGEELKKSILKMIDEQLFDGQEIHLLPVDETDDSCTQFRLFFSSEISGVVQNGPFDVVPHLLFPKDSREAKAINAASRYHQKVLALSKSQDVPVTQADVDMAATRFEASLSA